MQFIEHGIFEVSTDSQLLLVNAKGPFNEELVKQYHQALEACILELEKFDSWSQIIVMHELSLFTPEAEQILIESLKGRKSRGLKNCAVVLINAQGRSLIEEQMARAYQTTKLNFAFFDSIDNAKNWLLMQQHN